MSKRVNTASDILSKKLSDNINTQGNAIVAAITGIFNYIKDDQNNLTKILENSLKLASVNDTGVNTIIDSEILNDYKDSLNTIVDLLTKLIKIMVKDLNFNKDAAITQNQINNFNSGSSINIDDKTAENTNGVSGFISDLINIIKEIGPAALIISSLSSVSKSLKDILEVLSNININGKKLSENTLALLDLYNKINSTPNNTNNINNFVNGISSMGTQLGKGGVVNTALSNISSKNITISLKDASKNINSLTIFVATTGLLFILAAYTTEGKLKVIMDFAKILILFFSGIMAALTLANAINGFINNKFGGNAMNMFNKLTDLITVLSLSMVIGPGLIKLFGLNYGQVLLFALELTLFLFTITLALQPLNRLIANEKLIQPAAVLIDTLATIMTIGPIILKLSGVGFGDVMKFTAELFLFTAALTFALWPLKLLMSDKLLNVHLDEAATLVTSLALIMVLGPLALKLTNVGFADVMKFTAELFLFTLFISAALIPLKLLVNEHTEKTIGAAKRFILTAALIMIGGPLLIKYLGGEDFYNEIELFKSALWGFILSLTLTMIPLIFLKNQSKTINAFTIAVLGITSALIIGPIMIKNWLDDDYYSGIVKVLTFAIIVLAFTYLMERSFKLLKDINVGDVLIFSISVSILVFTLALGPTMFAAFGVKWTDVLLFGVYALISTTVFLLLFKVLGSSLPAIAQGAIVVTLIAGTVIVLAYAIKSLCGMLKEVNNTVETVNLKNILSFGTLIGGLIAGLTTISFFDSYKVALITPALLSISLTVYSLSKAIKSIGEVLKYLDSNHINSKELSDSITNVLTSVINPIRDLLMKPEYKEWFKDDGIFVTTSPMKRLVDSLSKIGNIISNVSTGLQAYASMKIPTYNSNGEIIGYHKLTEPEVNLAMQNIGTVLTTILKSIFGKEGIMNDPLIKEWFDPKWWGGEGDGAKVLKSLSKVGDLITNIAKSIKDYSEFNFGKNNTLDKTTFDQAAEHIKQVITCVIRAIGDCLKDKDIKDFFSSWCGESNGSKMIKSLSNLGTIIKDIADGVKTYSELNINTDFTAAGNNIGGFISGFINKIKDINPDDINSKLFDNLSETIKKISSSIKDINNEINLQSNNQVNGFNQTLDSYSQFVTLLNSLDTTKIDKTYQLIHELNTLTSSVKNIDKLSDTIVLKLVEVIGQLAEQLYRSSNIINSSKQLEQERGKKIQDYITLLGKLFNNPVKLSITAQEGEQVDEQSDNGTSYDANQLQWLNGGSSNSILGDSASLIFTFLQQHEAHFNK